MFSNFKAAFKEKPSYESEIPEGILKAISEPLPDGFKYVNVENGICRIETDGEFVVGSDSIKLPENAKQIFNEKISMDEIWTYLYNSQQQAEILPDKDGCYKINGIAFKASELIVAPFRNNIVQESTHFYMVPPKFPEAHSIEIGSDEYRRNIVIQQKANNSTTVFKFDSIDDEALNISFSIDSKTDKFTFTIGVYENKAKTIDEIVKANEIYNAFMTGHGYICGVNVPLADEYKGNEKPEEVVEFWKKVLELEKYLGARFKPGEDITMGLVNSVSVLYDCLIKKIPYKKYEKYENVSGKGFHEKAGMDKDMIGKEIYFEMSAECSVDIMGSKISLYQLIGIFKAVVVNQRLPKKGTEEDFYIELDAKDGEKMYSGNMLFTKEEELKQYRDNPEHIQELREAKESGFVENED